MEKFVVIVRNKDSGTFGFLCPTDGYDWVTQDENKAYHFDTYKDAEERIAHNIKNWNESQLPMFGGVPPKFTIYRETSPMARKEQIQFATPAAEFKKHTIHLEDDGFKGLPEIDWNGLSVYSIYADVLTAVNQLRQVTHGAFDPDRDEFTIRVAQNQMQYLKQKDCTGWSVSEKIRHDWKKAAIVPADKHGAIRNVADVKVTCDMYEFRAVIRRVNDMNTAKEAGM